MELSDASGVQHRIGLVREPDRRTELDGGVVNVSSWTPGGVGDQFEGFVDDAGACGVSLRDPLEATGFFA